MLLIVTCRLSGFCRIIPCQQKDTVERTAQRFFGAWVSVFGAPKSIIADRDKAWTSKLWRESCRLIGTDLHLTTAYQPQSDGRSEKTNKTVIQMIRSQSLKRQTKWLAAVPSTEYAINLSINVAIGCSPFELVFGKKPGLFQLGSFVEGKGKTRADWFLPQQNEWAAARDKLWMSRVNQAIQYNRRRREHDQLQVGDWVLVEAKNRGTTSGRQQMGAEKLKERYQGPFEVTKISNDGRNCELKLNENDKSFNNFHISKLKVYKHRYNQRVEAGSLGCDKEDQK